MDILTKQMAFGLYFNWGWAIYRYYCLSWYSCVTTIDIEFFFNIIISPAQQWISAFVWWVNADTRYCAQKLCTLSQWFMSIWMHKVWWQTVASLSWIWTTCSRLQLPMHLGNGSWTRSYVTRFKNNGYHQNLVIIIHCWLEWW